MESEFIVRLNQLTLALALAVYLAAGLHTNFFEPLGVLLGALWGISNLYLLKMTLEKWLKIGPRNPLLIFALLQLKFPVLYLAGYGLLRMKLFPVFYLLMGSSLVFLAMFFLGIYMYAAQLRMKA